MIWNSIPADLDTYIDLHIKLYIRGKSITGEGTDLEPKNFTAVTNKFLHSILCQYKVTLNDVPTTQSSEL